MSLRGQLGVWRVPFARCSSPFIPWLPQVKKSAKKLQSQSTEPARRPSQKEKRGRSEEKPRARSGPMLPLPPHGLQGSPQLRGGPRGPKSVLETEAVEESGSQDSIRLCRSLSLGDPIPGAPSCIWDTCGCHTGVLLASDGWGPERLLLPHNARISLQRMTWPRLPNRTWNWSCSNVSAAIS